MTLSQTGNEKNETFAVFLQLSVQYSKNIVLGVNGKRHFSIFVLFDLFKDYKKNKSEVIFAVFRLP